MLDYLILGMIQGIFEWLPVSSEGMVTLASVYLGVANPLQLALYLHLGTVLAVIVYFRKEIMSMDKDLAQFIAIATAVSLAVGLPLYLILKTMDLGSPFGFLIIGLGLVATGFLIKKNKGGFKTMKKATGKDAITAGFLQGLAVIPGVSRSGITLFALLAKEFEPKTALTISFLMSVPVVLAADVFILLDGFTVAPQHLFALVPAFLFGMGTIHILLRLSKKLSFSYFAWGFGLISILAYFLA